MSFWYDSNKPNEAVQLSDDLKMPLLVFTKDDSPKSNQMEQILDSGKVDHVIEGKYIAVKVNQASEAYKELSQIISISKVPSISIFLDRNIRALIDEVDQGVVKLVEDLSTALNMIKRIDQGEDVSSLKESLGSDSSTTLNLRPLSAEEKEKQKEELKKKLEQRREERLKKEKEEEKTREASRRTMGKELSSVRKELQDKEHLLILEKKKQEKKEELAARRRVKEQIAQDKAERAARRLQASEAAKEQEAQANAVKATSTVKETPTTSKLSIRLLDGSVQRVEFKAEDNLKAVIDHIVNNFLPGEQICLTLSYPMKKFNKDDESKSLLDLGLCPNNSLVVKRA